MSAMQRDIIFLSFEWIWEIAGVCISGCCTLIVRSLQVACSRNQLRSAA